MYTSKTQIPTKVTGDSLTATEFSELNDNFNSAVDDIEALYSAGGGGGVTLGETSTTAYRGDRGKTAYDHSQATHQSVINGTGLVRANGTSLSYDNTSYVSGTPWTSVGYWYSSNHPTTTSGYGLPDYPTTLPASDVSSWAKASTKPSYSYSEIVNHPTALSQFTNDLGNYGNFVTGTPWTSMGYVTGTPWTSMGYVTGTPWTSMGYLTSQTSHADVVVDGDFTSQGLMARGASSGTYSIVTDNSTNWNTAYGWGNHASANYASQASVNGKVSIVESSLTGIYVLTQAAYDAIVTKDPAVLYFIKSA